MLYNATFLATGEYIVQQLVNNYVIVNVQFYFNAVLSIFPFPVQWQSINVFQDAFVEAPNEQIFPFYEAIVASLYRK